jgi:hypothetical protein
VLTAALQSTSESATIQAAAGVSESANKNSAKSNKKKKKADDWDDDWGGGSAAAANTEEVASPVFDTAAGKMVDVELLTQAGPALDSDVPALALASANHAQLTAGRHECCYTTLLHNRRKTGSQRTASRF